MELGASVFSLLFFITFCIYIFWGVYIILLNPKSSTNRIFFHLCILLSIWSFGFAIANSALSMEMSLFWRRFAALGWTAAYSVFLHFILVLTDKNKMRKQKYLVYLLYLPALVNMYVFAFSNKLTEIQYNLVASDLGWTNISANNKYDLFFNVYYISFMVISLALVWKWKQRLKDEKITKQANLIIGMILFSGLVGSFTDVVVSGSFANPIPQMAPIFILLPIGAFYYSTKYYDVLNIEAIKVEETLVTSKEQKKIFTNLALAILITSILAFIAEYNIIALDDGGDLNKIFFKSGPLVALGITMILIQKIQRENLKETLTTLVLIVSIPLVAISFLKYSAVTAWVFPILIILSSLLFNNRTLLIGTSVVAIGSQRLIWLLKPSAYVLVNEFDYVARMVIILAAFFMGSYINKVYINKIRENTHQIEFQKMVSKVSFDFVNFGQENFNEKINSLLGEIGKYFDVDRTYLFTINQANKTMTYSNKWCNKEIEEEVGTIEDIPLEVFPWWIDQLKKNNQVYIKDVDHMPLEAKAEQDQLYRQNVKSLVSVPIISEGEIQAFIGIDSVGKTKEWSPKKIELLNTMANILSSGITQLNADKKIDHMAYYDDLTKLPNRFLFDDRVNQAIKVAKVTGDFISLVFIDLDSFKSVNDTIGHGGGDYLLVEVANSLKKLVRKTDTVARFGGDEFMILINNITDMSVVTSIADKVMNVFLKTFSINDQDFFVTASAGIATFPFDGEDAETLLKNADLAMYKAKSKGKNQYAICSKEMKDQVQINIDLSNDLYLAIEREELLVYYQAQIDLASMKIRGLEALLRWKHPTKGMIPPGIFIPIAEKNGLINKIGEWVLKEACQQNKKWQDMGLPLMDVAINLSSIQIVNPKIAENIEEIIKKTGLDPKYIELEITESIAIKEADYVISLLNKLKKIGVSIAIDDFGTEYSSLSRLKLLPIDRIKIDMQFVQGIETNEKDKAVTLIIIDLAKSLGLDVIAEGVETKIQLDYLKEKMCDSVQGYYFYKPMPGQEMQELLVDLHSEEDKRTPEVIEFKPTVEL